MTTSLSVRAIIGIVSGYYDIAASDITSERRDDITIRARHVAIWLARHHTSHSLTVIGRAFGGREHTTIGYVITKMPEKLAKDAVLASNVKELEGVIAAAAETLNAKRIILKSDIDPYAVAARIVAARWHGTTVSLEEMRAVAEALLAHLDSYALPESPHEEAP